MYTQYIHYTIHTLGNIVSFIWIAMGKMYSVQRKLRQTNADFKSNGSVSGTTAFRGNGIQHITASGCKCTTDISTIDVNLE